MNSGLILKTGQQYTHKVHVSAGNAAYFFTKQDEEFAISYYADRHASASSDGFFKTSKGVLVPIHQMPNIVCVDISWHLLSQAYLSSWTTTQKGEWATKITCAILDASDVPYSVVTNYSRQIYGQDIELTETGAVLQVKCDARAYSKKHGGTGNLYLEIAECNIK